MVAKALSALLDKAKHCGFIDGFAARSTLEAITHLQFTDDTIIFNSSRYEEVVVLRRILRSFELGFGLKINVGKGMVVRVSCSIEDLANKLHCKVGKLLFLYLDLPVKAKHKVMTVWDPIVQSFERKLSTWKRSYLSLPGRITLIKPAFSNLPVYYMSLLLMLASIRNKLDRIIRNLLWDGHSGKRSFTS